MTMYVNPTAQQPSEEERNAAEAAAERRRASRIKRKFITQATLWAPGHPSVPFDVIIEDISESGAGLLHDRAMDIGLPLLLTVPTDDDGHSKLRQYIVARCTLRHDSKYAIGLELNAAAPDHNPIEPKRVCSKRLKLLFLLFGIFGLIIAAFAPLGN